jgi:ribosome biogenesis GTPase / thiamine phosphate phosphatase
MAKYKNLTERDLERLEKKTRIGKKKTINKNNSQSNSFELAESQWAHINEPDATAFRVVEVHKRYAFISPETELLSIDTRDVRLATVAKKHLTTIQKERNFICVGDRVLGRPARPHEHNPSSELPQVVILHASPRSSQISRIDPGRSNRNHVLASNIDRLVFVASYLKPTIKWGLIDRYLTIAEVQELPITIVLNKKDLLKEGTKEFLSQCSERVAYYRSLGYEVIELQATKRSKCRSSVERLRDIFNNSISLVSGHSGVGKSSLVNLFKPEIEQDTEVNDDIFYKGRHTTSYASLIRLGTGGFIIDSPGIRSFCIEEKTSIDLTYCFKEFRPYVGQCQFRECRHIEEPHCVIRELVLSGKIPEWRYRSFVAILSGASGREGRIRDIELESN